METATKLKFSRQTLDILKNYASINSNILIKPGNTITTISPIKNILSEAEIEETFDSTFGIWDLPKFLGTISLFNDPDFDFQDKFVMISDQNRSIKYHYSDPKLLTVPTKKINMPKIDVSFSITEKQISELRKAASILGVSDLTIEKSDDEELIVKVHDKKDSGSNSYILNIENQDTMKDGNFSLNFMVENLKMINDDYTIEISSNVVSRFTGINKNIKYWIALEMDSIYQS